MILHLLAAGASQGLVAALRPRLAAETGAEIAAVFTAAGTIRSRFLAGEACDVVILTAAFLDELDTAGLLLAGTAAPIGLVRTGVAVPVGRPVPDLATGDALAAALRAAPGIYVPDPERSTAGIHLMRVLDQLGLASALAARVRPFPNGETAMRELAAAPEADAIGATQITEIKATPGLTLAGPLPAAFGLATVYAAAVSARSTRSAAAGVLVRLLTGAATEALRTTAGFEPPPAVPRS
jgi:molybdate transport system substrate-binding protein